MALKLITPPAVEPVTLVEAKKHLRVDHSDDDTFIGALITAVRTHLDARDGWLGIALVEQTWELHLDAFPADEIELPFGPLQSVSSVKYDDDDGNEQTLSASTDYTVDLISKRGWVLLSPDASWPSTFDGINAVRVRFVTGYPVVGGVATTPAAIKAAMLLMIGALYEHRENVVIGSQPFVLPNAAESLLSTYTYRVFA